MGARATAAGRGRAPAPTLRLVPARRPRIADVALFYGERSGGIRTYLDAKAEYAARSGAFEHHLLIPGRARSRDGARHELRSLALTASNGYRLPLGTGALEDTLRRIHPDLIVVHDPFWALRGAARVGAAIRAPVVACHHASSELDAAGVPGPTGLYRYLFRAWIRRSYRRVDAVMSAIDAAADGRAASIRLRFGLDPAFRPCATEPAEHVLYVGRIAREKGIFELLEATARERWPLRLVGCGSALPTVLARARRLGLERRLSIAPYVADRAGLAREYARASAVVMPGRYETFGLVALEAAATGASVVACETAPSAALAAPLVSTFAPGDVAGLAAAITRARSRRRDPEVARRLAEEFTWERAFESELSDLSRLLR